MFSCCSFQCYTSIYKSVTEIKDSSGISHTDDNNILKECTKYYLNLFASKNISQKDIDRYLSEINIQNTLNQNQKEKCDEHISEKELKNVVNKLKNGKSPGCDGLTPEFYKKYWEIIKNLFINMVNETYKFGELPYTLRKAILALLFKKGDNTLLKNYRPISLTNYDYKIICFVLANRMQNVLTSIIHEDQTGYIRGRYIGSNARLLEDYFEHCDSFQIPGILLLLDFEKAFDSIEWNFMTSVLTKFNFGEGFIKWVKILYNKPIISIKNNGWLSEDINLFRGVRQGCPLSALLFVLAVEIMAISIRNNNTIHGFQCNDSEIKESMYADDTTLLLSDLDSVDNAITAINNFSKVAGPKLNMNKTEGILLGPLKDSIRSYNEINFTNDAVRCLGIYIGHDKNECLKKNWVDKLEKIKIIFERWKGRNLTIFGKILIIKSLATSMLIHTMSILEVPDDILKEIEKMIFNFLWNSHERIKRKTLIGNKESGGVEMLDIFCKNKALKAAWLRKLHTKNPNSEFVNMYLKKFGFKIDYLIKCNTADVNQLIKELNLPKFWAEVFAYANECKSIKNIENMSESEFLAEPIWFNTKLKINNKPIFLSNWTKSNILYIKDLFDRQGNLITENMVQNILIYKRNWIAEFYKIKKVLKKQIRNFDTSLAKFINIKDNWDILVNNSKYSMKEQKSRFYYRILVDKKFDKNYMEKSWENSFYPNINWKSVYRNQVWGIQEKKIGEFNYKLLCNILCTRSVISKWNKNINSKCQFCGDTQNVKHLIFDCPRVQNLWQAISTILQVNISYKHIIIGNVVSNDYIASRNLVISYITYGIYKFWILAENKKLKFDTESLHRFVKKDLFKRSTYNSDKIFIMLVDKIFNSL